MTTFSSFDTIQQKQRKNDSLVQNKPTLLSLLFSSQSKYFQHVFNFQPTTNEKKEKHKHTTNYSFFFYYFMYSWYGLVWFDLIVLLGYQLPYHLSIVVFCIILNLGFYQKTVAI